MRLIMFGVIDFVRRIKQQCAIVNRRLCLCVIDQRIAQRILTRFLFCCQFCGIKITVAGGERTTVRRNQAPEHLHDADGGHSILEFLIIDNFVCRGHRSRKDTWRGVAHRYCRVDGSRGGSHRIRGRLLDDEVLDLICDLRHQGLLQSNFLLFHRRGHLRIVPRNFSDNQSYRRTSRGHHRNAWQLRIAQINESPIHFCGFVCAQIDIVGMHIEIFFCLNLDVVVAV